MPKCDILLEKRKVCDFHGDCGTEIYGMVVVIPAPELGPDKTKKAFICEPCIKNQLGKIEDFSYMVKEDALH